MLKRILFVLFTAFAFVILSVSPVKASPVHTVWIGPGDERWTHGDQYVVKAGDFGTSTWLESTGAHSFRIYAGRSSRPWSAYPYIGRGCSWTICAGSAWPVKVGEAGYGNPHVSLWTTQNWRGSYNTSLDIWFSTWKNRDVQNNGTEIMIWTNHPNVYVPEDWSVYLDGQWWWVMSWRAHAHGTSWNYVAFIAQHQSGEFYGNLNPFFWKTESYGLLRSNWYWTGIEAGFELDGGGSGVGLGVNYFAVNR